MGVNGLWKILGCASYPINLSDLRNKTLAVDLSVWICENSHFKFHNGNQKPHLRALFFRCKALLENGCKLIFVREGDVLELKQDTMKKRNQARFGEYSSSQQCSQASSQQQPFASQTTFSQTASASKPIKKRTRFDAVADEVFKHLLIDSIIFLDYYNVSAF
jgi:hypothetical protein